VKSEGVEPTATTYRCDQEEDRRDDEQGQDCVVCTHTFLIDIKRGVEDSNPCRQVWKLLSLPLNELRLWAEPS
jgi:hypothetical protein